MLKVNEAERSHLWSDAPRYADRTAAISLRALIDVLRRRWRTMLLCIMASIALAAIYLHNTPDKFGAMASLLIDSRRAQLSQSDGAATVVDQSAIDTQIEMLKSERIVLQVIDKLKLTEDPEFSGEGDARPSPLVLRWARELVDRLKVMFGPAPTDQQMRMATPMARDVLIQRQTLLAVMQQLFVARAGRTYVVEVRFSSSDPIKSARIANAISEAYISDQLEAKRAESRYALAWLEGEVNDKRELAGQAYRAGQEFKSQYSIDPQRELTIGREFALSTQRAGQTTETLATLQGQIDKLVADAAAADHDVPPPRPLLEAIAAASGAGAAVPQADWAAVTSAVQALQRRATELAESAGRDREQAETMRRRSADMDASQTKLRDIETAAAMARSRYESLLNQLTHASQTQSAPASDGRIVTLAAPPLWKTSPRGALTLLLAGLAGICLGTSAAFVREHLDSTVRTREQAERALQGQCLGSVPNAPKARPAQHGAPDKILDARRKVRRTLAGVKAMIDMNTIGREARVVALTSAVRKEGRSTLAFHLAEAIARTGASVLLIDCDFTDPYLSDILPSHEDEQPQWLIKTDFGFDFVPAAHDNEAEGMFDLSKFEDMIEVARANYKYVIVDLPPVLPCGSFHVMAPFMDAFVFVVRWGKTTIDQLDRAMLNSRGLDGRMLGILLNGVSPGTLRRWEGSGAKSYGDFV